MQGAPFDLTHYIADQLALIDDRQCRCNRTADVIGVRAVGASQYRYTNQGKPGKCLPFFHRLPLLLLSVSPTLFRPIRSDKHALFHRTHTQTVIHVVRECITRED